MSSGAFFDAMLSGLVETFSPVLEVIFRKVEVPLSSTTASFEEFEQMFSNLFTTYPENIQGYSKLIKTVVKFAKSNLNDSLINLCSKIKAEANRQIGSPFSVLQITSLSFRLTNFNHFHFLRYFHIFVFTDIIYGIVCDVISEQNVARLLPFSKIVQTGFNISIQTTQFKALNQKLIKKWGIVFFKISDFCLKEMEYSFVQNLDDNNMDITFDIVSYVHSSQQLLDNILMTVKNARKKKILTSEMLSAIANMVSLDVYDDGILKEFFDIAWAVRNSNDIKNGAIDLITALIPIMPSMRGKIASFFKDRVYKHAGTDTKLRRSAEAFLRLIRGDTRFIIKNEFLPEEYVSCKCCQSDPTNEFMHHFYPKAHFSVCPDVFVNIFIHLAAVDTVAFRENLLPQAIQTAGIVHNVALLAISHICTPTFIKESCIKKEQLNAIIAKGRSTIFNDLTGLVHTKTTIYESSSLMFYYGNTNNDINEFISKNKLSFEMGKEYSYSVDSVCDKYSLGYAVARTFAYLLNSEDINDAKIFRGLVVLAASTDPLVHRIAMKEILNIYKDNRKELVMQCTRIIKETMSTNIRYISLFILYILVDINEICKDLVETIDSVCIIMLSSNLRDIRVVSIAILRRISIFYEDSVYGVLTSNHEFIESEIYSILRANNVSDNLNHEERIINVPDWEKVAKSSYNTLWYYYYSVLLSVIIETRSKMLQNINTYASALSKAAFSDSVVPNPIPYMVLMIGTFVDAGLMPLVDDINNYIHTIIKSENNYNINYLIQALRLLNYRVIPAVIQEIINIDNKYYVELAHSMSQLIRIPVVFSNSILELIDPFIDFLANLQKYFTSCGINSQKDIDWSNKKSISLLKDKEDICIDYCIIVATFFNNVHDQVEDEFLPLSSRQVMVKMLINWVNIPGDFSKLQAYAMNALIPLISSGTIFTDGFSFDPQMLDRLITVQLEGYPVLDSLVRFHSDILINEFVSQFFLRPCRLSVIFANAIISAIYSISETSESNEIHKSVGALLLFSQRLLETRPNDVKLILRNLPDGSRLDFDKIINEEFLITNFEYATEQVIFFGINMIKHLSEKNIIIDQIIGIIRPWFSKIRILPTNSLISNARKNFRCYNVMSFLLNFTDVTVSINEEQRAYMSILWNELMKLNDNYKVIFIVLFLMDDTSVKTKIFQLLCENMSGMVTKYLARHCRFSFWYYLSTCNISINSVMWCIPILQICFSEHIKEAAPYYSTVLHFALIFYEETQKLYENLFCVFGDEITQEIEMLGINGNMVDDNLGDIARIISNKLGSETKNGALEKWSLEAIKWATCCKDLKQATRSMIILNSINIVLNPSFMTLLKEAVKYHLKNIEDNTIQFGYFMKAVFMLLSSHVMNPQFSEFAFEFASKFVNFTPLMKVANAHALPIFIDCFNNGFVSASEYQPLIIDSFSPFLSDIEFNSDSHEALDTCIQLTNSPVLKLISIVVSRIRSKKSASLYDEAFRLIQLPNQANKLLAFFGIMLESCSEELVSSIYSVVHDLLIKFQGLLSENLLIPICHAALKRIVFIEAASSLLILLSKVNPVIASLEFDQGEGYHNINNVISSLDQIKTPICEKSPINNCKDIATMFGMISQIDPPRIYPFYPQVEMVNALKAIKRTDHSSNGGLRKWYSTLNISASKSTNQSMYISNYRPDKVTYTKIEPKKIKLIRLNLPNDDDFKKHILLSNADFVACTQ